MIISHNFGIGLKEYQERGISNAFPLFDHCPHCHCVSHGNIHRHGFYWRNGVNDELTVRIPICRMKCLMCQTSFSILPDFLLPYFQYTLFTILSRIKRVLDGKKNNTYWQLLHFHLKRYLKNLKWIHSYFIDNGSVSGISCDERKEAKKYMKRILDFGESSFLRRSWGHLSKYFMAH
ncbi:DUF6431 domain-containing protein [Sporosarcina jeotgali]|uniref:DUF6431 domain-containing protein n=1 Tax=Sporosarcina jeotgali TaxID=3020056 RepID=A0ABZ0KWI6_9BACL|nr:DUF6431 domain-containing protein [Sporosarcina sp. B2O-1]WOV84760.1 DUF6431 domain-containing protein [Sporosarcina sp. B2O-1]